MTTPDVMDIPEQNFINLFDFLGDAAPMEEALALSPEQLEAFLGTLPDVTITFSGEINE